MGIETYYLCDRCKRRKDVSQPNPDYEPWKWFGDTHALWERLGKDGNRGSDTYLLCPECQKALRAFLLGKA